MEMHATFWYRSDFIFILRAVYIPMQADCSTE